MLRNALLFDIQSGYLCISFIAECVENLLESDHLARLAIHCLPDYAVRLYREHSFKRYKHFCMLPRAHTDIQQQNSHITPLPSRFLISYRLTMWFSTSSGILVCLCVCVRVCMFVCERAPEYFPNDTVYIL